jgi:Putative prokaryotic signal transducing protein
MITVYRAANIADGYLIRSMLEAEGIPVFIENEHMDGLESSINRDMVLQVAAAHAADARAIVEAWDSSEPVPFDGLDESEDNA